MKKVTPEQTVKSKLILRLALVLSGGLFGCSTTVQHSNAVFGQWKQSITDLNGKLMGRWTVEGTDDIVTLAEGNSASLKSGGKVVTGSYRMLRQDLLTITLRDTDLPPEQREVYYDISPDAWSSRILQRVHIEVDPNSSRIIHF